MASLCSTFWFIEPFGPHLGGQLCALPECLGKISLRTDVKRRRILRTHANWRCLHWHTKAQPDLVGRSLKSLGKSFYQQPCLLGGNRDQPDLAALQQPEEIRRQLYRAGKPARQQTALFAQRSERWGRRHGLTEHPLCRSCCGC